MRSWYLNYLKLSPKLQKIILYMLFCLPILVFSWSFIRTGNLIAPGDGDYLMQTQQAMRISILKFHQFPWLNPWVSGGVPLFANPQFGLFSLTTPLTLLFGAIVGFKLSLALYFYVGFFGFRSLFIKGFKTPPLTATLLAYIWTFGSFMTQRVSGGHFTFVLIELFPWALLFYMQRRTFKYAWLKFALIISLMANSAAHYITILSYLVLALIFIFEGVRIVINKQDKSLALKTTITSADLRFWLKAGMVFLALSGYRLLFTLLYLKDFPRLENSAETSAGIAKGLFSMFGPLRQYVNTPSLPQWGWLETSAYIGICTGLAALVVLYVLYKNKKNTRKVFSYSPYVILALIITFFILGLGGFAGSYSPYILLRQLPILQSMRVATRWYLWSSIFTLVFIAAYLKDEYRKLINILLFVSCFELFIYSRPYLAKPYIISEDHARNNAAPFEQKKEYNNKRYGIPYDENFTEATDNNYGQLIAGDSLIDTRWEPPFGLHTERCSIDAGCGLVLSKNANLVSWSPNKIVLKRVGDGPIYLNINPGKYWRVNKIYTFLTMKTVETSLDFKILSTDTDITVDYVPRLSVNWLINKLTKN
jgi:hypothetical protein